MRKLAVILLSLFFVAACGKEPANEAGPAPAINATALAAHIKTLSSDEFGGRGPATPGEELTINYMAGQFKKFGLKPGMGDSYFQDVPLVSITARPDAVMSIAGKGDPLSLTYGDEMMVWTKRVVDTAAVSDSEMVFVGYGIVAPEYGWNDYAGIDVKGKTVVILVNDPGYATQDEALFTGNAMTYYGRWTYKYEEAARQGAAAAIIIHRTAPAGYPWEVVSGSWSGPQFDLVRADDNMSRVAIEGWLTEASARRVLKKAGLSLDALDAAAARRGFKAVPLGLALSVKVDNTVSRSRSHNVIAWLPSSEKPDEYFLYMAHWDHLGTDPTIKGDGIYNGALDNASGSAALLQLAEAFGSLKKAPGRSVVFISVTAEEQGLLGSAHYAANPVFPLAKTVGGLNMDGINIIGPTRDITVTGYGASDLDGIMERLAQAQGRVVRPDPAPEKGYYYRSDHFELAKRGVPMIYPNAGINHVVYGAEWGQRQSDDYVAKRYHKPADEYDPAWDLSGAVQDINLYFRFGQTVANSDKWPNWHDGNEFRAIRDASRAP